MNNLIIPPSPNWYESRILACTADNTIVYGAKSEIAVVKPQSYDKPADIKIIPHAHYDRITSIDVNPNWGPGNMFCVSAGEDRIVKLWDLENYTSKCVNNSHTANSEKLVGAVFAGNDRIVAVSENGFTSLWRILTNEIIPLKNLFNFKVNVTAISACPHSSWLVAFGLKCGLVVIADLRKNGRILYKMRGHDKAIVSLSWCPIPYNIFPTKKVTKKENPKIENIECKDEITSTENKVVSEAGEGIEIKQDIESPMDLNDKEIALESVENVGNSNDEKSPSTILEHINDKLDNLCINTTEDMGDCSSVGENKNTAIEQSNASVEVEDVCLDKNIEISTDVLITDHLAVKVEEVDGTNDTNPLVREYLLASSSKGGSIYIWRAGTDGRKQVELYLLNHRNRRKYRGPDKTWITLCWITPHILLSSSPVGELLQWDLLKTNKDTNTPQKKLIHYDHRSNLFVIAAPIQLFSTLEDENWRNKKDLFAWTLGQERFLLCTSLLADRTTFVSYPTNGGFIYCLASSPLDPNRLAVGIGDNTAKIWDLSRPHLQCIIMANLWQKIQSKVLTLAWHPSKESILAYGTFEGRMGLINASNTSKMPVLLTQHFRTAVTKIIWGPLNGNTDTIGLYACGEGQVAIYNTDKLYEGEVKIMQIGRKEYVTSMAWKPDYSMFSVGTKMGSIAVYNSNLESITTIYAQHKTITNLLWHPEATAEDTETSPYNSWLAASTTDASIIIYDFSKEKGGDDKEDGRLLAVLNGHSKPVKSLCWSSYEGAKLVSAGEDGVAQVWDVKSKTIISTYTGHNIEAILAVLWSPLDPNFIITGGKDNCIRIWNITENKPMTEEELIQVRKERSKLKQEFKKHKQVDESDDEQENLKSKRGVMLNLTARAQNNPLKVLEDCRHILLNGESQENPIKIDNSEELTNNYFDLTKLFGDKNSVVELLETEQKSHMEKKKYICNQHISLWKGDIAETLRKAIKNGTVNPWLISMAPMVSPKLWQEACEVYATKLLESKKADPIEVVSYLLACHKVDEAIDVLCNGTLFREALALAKCRLVKNGPIINEIISKWATFSIVNGAYEIAAQCFIVLEQFDEAAKALFKRSDEAALKLALELADKSGNKDLKDAVTMRYNTFKNQATDQDDVKIPIEVSQDLRNIDNDSQSIIISEKTDENSDLTENTNLHANPKDASDGCNDI